MEIIVEAASILDEAVVLEEKQYKQKVSVFKRIARVLTGLFKDLKKLIVIAIKKRNFGAVKTQWSRLCENAKRNLRKYDTHSEWVEKIVDLEKQDEEGKAKSMLERMAEDLIREAKRVDEEAKKRFEDIKSRHAAAAKTIEDSLKNIYRNVNGETKDTSRSDAKVEKTENSDELDRISKDLDDLLADL